MREKQHLEDKKQAKKEGKHYEDPKHFDLAFEPDKNIKKGIKEMPDTGRVERVKNDHTDLKKFFKPGMGVLFSDHATKGLNKSDNTSSSCVLHGPAYVDPEAA